MQNYCFCARDILCNKLNIKSIFLPILDIASNNLLSRAYLQQTLLSSNSVPELKATFQRLHYDVWHQNKIFCCASDWSQFHPPLDADADGRPEGEGCHRDT